MMELKNIWALAVAAARSLTNAALVGNVFLLVFLASGKSILVMTTFAKRSAFSALSFTHHHFQSSFTTYT